MKRLTTLLFATTLLLCPWAGPVYAEDAYKPPYPHSTGAQLLPLCQDQDAPVDLLRCDYYVQGIADLATTPVQGERLACIPRGKNRTELMEFAVEHLASLKPDVLENNSAASLVLTALQKEFQCPEKEAADKKKKKSNPAMEAMIRRALELQEKEKQAGEAGTQ